MQQNNPNENRLHVHYSPNAFHSIGAVIHRFRHKNQDDVYAASAQWNHLVFRHNTRHSQANIYSKFGIGLADEFTNHVFSTLSVAADWETRRWFTAYEANAFWSDSSTEFSQSARLGVAPYVAEYGALHTWLMLQVNHQPEAEDTVILTPLVRLFKGSTLTELGIDDNGDILFNWIIRF